MGKASPDRTSTTRVFSPDFARSYVHKIDSISNNVSISHFNNVAIGEKPDKIFYFFFVNESVFMLQVGERRGYM